MHELVTVEAFGRGLLVAAIAWVIIGAAVTAIRKARGLAWKPSAIVAATGLLAIGLWYGYLYSVRVNPETGYVGLHKVWVFALNGLIFIACGCVVGYLVGKTHNNGGKSEG